MKKYARALLKSISWIVVIFLITISVVIIFSSFSKNKSINILTVQSGSMEPNIKLGSVVVVKNSNDYKIRDVITYISDDNSSTTTTHRINAIEYEDDGSPKYITKGDANNVEDGGKIDKNQVLGKVIFNIPYLGYAIKFVKAPIGLIIFLIIPAIIFIANELSVIKKEIVLIRSKK